MQRISFVCVTLFTLCAGMAVAGPVTTGYLYFAGGALVNTGVANPTLDGTLTGDNGVFSVFVANVDITAGTVTNWRYATNAGNQLPLDNPNTVATEAYSWMFLEDSCHVYNGRLYVGPGDWNNDGTRSTADVVVWADIDPQGSLGPWTFSDPVVNDADEQAICATAIVDFGTTAYYYVLGGTGSGLARVAYASINTTTGVLGSWQSATAPLPSADWFNRATVAGTAIIHGAGNLRSPAGRLIDYATPVAGTGNITSWLSGGAYDPTTANAWDYAMVTATVGSNEYAVIAGGAPNPPSANVWVSPVTAGVPGAWTATTALPTGRRRVTAAAAKDLVIIPGGAEGGSTVDLGVAGVYIGRVNSSGAIPSWTTGESMPQARSFGGAAFYLTDFPAVTGVEDPAIYR